MKREQIIRFESIQGDSDYLSVNYNIKPDQSKVLAGVFASNRYTCTKYKSAIEASYNLI